MGWNDHLPDGYEPEEYERFVEDQFAKADADRKRERESGPPPGVFDLRKQLGRAPTVQEYRDSRDVSVWHCPLCRDGRPCDRHARS